VKPGWAALRWLQLALAIMLILPYVVSADEPLAQQAERFILPWTPGDHYAITWGPDDHWASNPHLGFAVDFALPEGTPPVCPCGW